jgi:hypothetical protein
MACVYTQQRKGFVYFRVNLIESETLYLEKEEKVLKNIPPLM